MDTVTDDNLLLNVDDVCRKLRLSRSTIYALVKSGELKSVAIGRARRFTIQDIEAYVAGLPRG